MPVTVYKQYKAAVQTVRGNTVRALVSVYNNVDLQGDRVMPGAFVETLDEWKASGDPIPVVWSHDWLNPLAHIGYVDPNKVDDSGSGLVIEAVIDSDTEFSAQVLRLLKSRRLTEWSWAYDIVEERTGPDGANELVRVKLLEVGPCLKGANPETDTLSRGELLNVKAVQGMFARGEIATGPEPPWNAHADLTKRLDELLPVVRNDVVDAFVAETRALDAAARALTEQVDEAQDTYAEEPRDVYISDDDLLTLNPAIRRAVRQDDDVDA
jgi:HK97 family phage prohead protease